MVARMNHLDDLHLDDIGAEERFNGSINDTGHSQDFWETLSRFERKLEWAEV